MKDLVVYYSYTGNTEAAAEALAAELKADIIKLEDIEKPSAFKAYISGAFAARKGRSWPVKPFNNNVSGYNKIFIGAPIWWGKTAPELNSFFDQTDLNGKSVIVFVTMGGSNPDEAINYLTDRVAQKGGKVISSFSIKTAGLDKVKIENKAKEAANSFK